MFHLFYSRIEEKIDRYIDWEEHWGNIFQTSLDNSKVDWHRLFINGWIFIMEIITGIQKPGGYFMRIRDINIDPEGVRMYHGTVGLIKSTPCISELSFAQ